MKIDFLESPNEDVRIEIIPLIDIIFCILTFFILAAVGLTRQQAIDLDLPSANTGNALPPQGIGSEALLRERLYVSVDAIGQVYIDQQPVTLNLLYDVLLQHQQVSPEGLIVLYASRDARYEDVIQVLDLLREVGGDRVALATLPGESLEAPTPGLESPLPGQTVPQDDELLNPSPFPSGIEPLNPGLEDPALQDRLPQVPTDDLDTVPRDPAAAPDEAE
jgi:biopolymer transport protein ExbD